jgi:hypothetical protein
MMRTVYLPAVDINVSLGVYAAGVKLAKANPDREFKHGLTCWWPCTGREIVRQFLAGVQNRINQGIPYSQRGK